MSHGTSKLNENGRIVIPVEIRRELGLEPGDELNLFTEAGRIVIETPEGLLDRLRAEIKVRKGDRSLVDELIEERRRTFDQEQAELGSWTRDRS